MASILSNSKESNILQNIVFPKRKRIDEYITDSGDNNGVSRSITTDSVTLVPTGVKDKVIGTETSGSSKELEKNPYLKHSQTLLNIINGDVFEAGIMSSSERFVKEMIESDTTRALEWLNILLLRSFRQPQIVIGILHIISHFEYRLVDPIGPTMALAALSHRDIGVREQAIRAYENWGDSSSLEILKGIHCAEPWLQDYVDQIICELEEE